MIGTKEIRQALEGKSFEAGKNWLEENCDFATDRETNPIYWFPGALTVAVTYNNFSWLFGGPGSGFEFRNQILIEKGESMPLSTNKNTVSNRRRGRIRKFNAEYNRLRNEYFKVDNIHSLAFLLNEMEEYIVKSKAMADELDYPEFLDHIQGNFNEVNLELVFDFIGDDLPIFTEIEIEDTSEIFSYDSEYALYHNAARSPQWYVDAMEDKQ